MGFVTPKPVLYRTTDAIVTDAKQLQRYLDTVYQALQCPSFRIHRNSVNQLAIATGVTTIIQWNSIAQYSPIGGVNQAGGWDTHNGYDFTNFVYVVKVPGVYQFFFSGGANVALAAGIQQT